MINIQLFGCFVGRSRVANCLGGKIYHMSKSEQLTGKHGEALAESTLHGLGVEMLEKIGTPVLTIPAGRGLFKVVWGEKVSGDRRGILPGGRSVLIEVKTILDRNLRYSDLREHQPERLQEHAHHGGLSLLVWVHNSGVYVMGFPISEFTSGTSISTRFAVVCDQATRKGLVDCVR